MYKTIIIKNSVSNCLNELGLLRDAVTEDGSVFCIVRTEYKDGRVEKDFMDVIQEGMRSGFDYVNTMVIPEKTERLDNALYCVWLVKNRNRYYFDKDKIREKSIWKDVEWGKRAKNYNSKGKDPGNVWIPTVDDGKANITEHILLTIEEVYSRLLSMTLAKGDRYLLVSDVENDFEFGDFEGEKRISETKYEDVDFGEYVGDKEISNCAGKCLGKVVFGTAEAMDVIDGHSVDLIVTSSPYWDLKNYYKKNQIGQEPYDVYAKRMYVVWKQCFDKLKDDGSLWININIRMRNGEPILLPKLFIDECRKIGFFYRGILIWHKSSGIPTSSRNLSDHHEYVLVFTKSRSSKINRDAFGDYSDYKNEAISGKLFWNINRKAGSVGQNTIHPAIFPTELVNRITQISTREGDMVVDPFLGSGTSLIASLNNHRRFVGYEYFEGFKSLMSERFEAEIDDCSASDTEFC